MTIDTHNAVNIVMLRGRNFSGRSAALRENAQRQGRPYVLIPPNAISAISGLAPDVHAELNWYNSSSTSDSLIQRAIEQLGLAELLPRNPMILSGGEQVCVAIVSAISQRPNMIGIDCAFEQLDSANRRTCLQLLSALPTGGCDVTLIDNRMASEANDNLDIIDLASSATNLPPRLDSTTQIYQPWTSPPALEAISLTHSYESTPLLSRVGIRVRSFARTRRTPTQAVVPRSESTLRPVLHDISFSLEPGRVYRLVGRNGAGKSTLAKILVGALRPSQGQLRLSGRRFEPWQFPGQLVAYHYQNPDMQMAETSVRRELQTSLRALTSPQRHECLRLRETPQNDVLEPVAQAFGLTSMLSAHPMDLPFVLRKRVMMAAAVATFSPWLIMDEPTLSQDDETIRALAEMLSKQARQGRGIIVITHSERFASYLGACELELKDGRLDYVGSAGTPS